MTSTPERYLVRVQGSPDAQFVMKGLAQAHDLAKKRSRRLILITPTDNQLRFTALAEVLGTGAVKALLGNSSVTLPDNVTLSHETEKTLRYVEEDSVLLVVYPDQRLLDKSDGYTQAAAMVVVPDIMDEADEWVRAWNPQFVGEFAPPAPAAPLIDNAVVEAGLKALTSRVNLRTGLASPSYKAVAVQLFRELRDAGERYDPSVIKAWALQNGWTPEGANELTEVAQGILDRRPLRGGKQLWRPDLIEELRKNKSGELAKPTASV